MNKKYYNCAITVDEEQYEKLRGILRIIDSSIEIEKMDVFAYRGQNKSGDIYAYSNDKEQLEWLFNFLKNR